MYFSPEGSFKSTLILLLFTFSIAHTSYSQGINGQDEAFFSQIDAEVNRLVNKHLSSLQTKNKSKYNGGNKLYNSFYTYTAADSLQAVNNAVVEAQRKRIERDIGVQFSVGYIDNFTNGFGDLGFFYRRAVQAGFDWNLFKGGWYESRYKAKEFYYGQQVQSLLNKDKEILVENNFLYNKILELFVQVKKQELERMKSFTGDYVEISKKLYYKKLLLWDEMLKLYSQQNEINNLIDNFNSLQISRDSAASVLSDYLPLLNIDQTKLVAYFDRIRYNDTIQNLHEEYLKYKYKTIRDLSLKPFLRYNYFDYTGVNAVSPNRDFVSAGFQFSVPLPLRARNNDQLKTLEAQQFKYQNNQDLKNDFNDLRGIYLDYQEQLNQYYDLYYQKLVLEEVIRREQAKQAMKDPDYSPVFIARQLNDWYRVKYDMIDRKESLYFLLVKIRALIPGAQITDFTEEIDLNRMVESKKTGNQSVYIWSRTFAETSNEKIVNDLKNLNIYRVILSLNQDDSLKVKAYELNKLLSREKIELHLMIGSNEFIYADKKDALKNALEYLLEIPDIAGIHLDIEPHTITALKKDRDKYQDMYVSMLEYARSLVKKKGLQLSVSIPVFYEKSKLEKIYLNADKVYLMAYEHPDADFIRRKVAEELVINKSKTVIALRTADFKDRNSLNQMIQLLNTSLDISEFAIHDLKSLKLLK